MLDEVRPQTRTRARAAREPELDGARLKEGMGGTAKTEVFGGRAEWSDNYCLPKHQPCG
jgi:hypothetical protein